MSASDFSDRNAKLVPVGVFAVAAAARLVAMSVACDPALTFDKFFTVAGELISDGWLPSEPFAYAPLYVYFVAGLLRLGALATAVCLVQVGLGAAACVAIWELTRRLFGATEALVAGLVSAVYGPFLLYSIAFESDGLGLFLFAVAAVVLVAAVERPGVAVFAVGGLLLGLRATVRPNVVVVVPVVVGLAWLVCRRHGSGRRAVALVVVLVAAFLAPVLPITWLNLRASGEMIPVMTSGGWVFYTSNNHAATGLSYYTPPLAARLAAAPLAAGERRSSRYDDAVSRQLADLVVGRSLSAGDSSRFWFREGWRSVARRGAGQLTLQATKLYTMFHAFEGHDNRVLLEKANRLGWLLAVGMGTVAPFGLVGLATTLFSRQRRRPELWIAVSLLVAPVLSMSVFYVAPRFRLELAAMLIPWAAATVVALARRRNLHVTLAVAISVAALGLACNLPWGEVARQERQRRVELHTHRGTLARDPRVAALEFTVAADAATYPAQATRAYQGLARSLRALGRDAEAAGFEDIARGELPDKMLADLVRRQDADALWAVGRHFFLSGDAQRAAHDFAAASRLRPHDPELLFSKAWASLAAGTATAEQVVQWSEKALDLGLRFHPDAVRAYLLVATWKASHGQESEAEEAVAAALRIEPDNAEALAMTAELGDSE